MVPRSARPATRAAIQKAKTLRRTLTPEEARVWVRLRRLKPQSFHFRRQTPVMNFIADFACLKSKLLVEIDGSHHGIGLHQSSDMRREELLAAAGFKVLRFWNSEVHENIESVVDTILAAARPDQG